MSETTVTIHIDDEIDRWEWRCPRGHTQWEPTNNHWWCARCASGHPDVEAAFTELTSARTGETVRRDEVILMTNFGPMKERQSATGD